MGGTAEWTDVEIVGVDPAFERWRSASAGAPDRASRQRTAIPMPDASFV
jgi:hypothetical protein